MRLLAPKKHTDDWVVMMTNLCVIVLAGQHSKLPEAYIDEEWWLYTFSLMHHTALSPSLYFYYLEPLSTSNSLVKKMD